MRKIVFALIVLPVIMLTGVSCIKDRDHQDIAVYNYHDSIVNPPAVFNIVFNITSVGDRIALIKFSENGVWRIYKQGDVKVNLHIDHNELQQWIVLSDTLGLEAGSKYEVVMNNNNYTDFRNYTIGFSKLEVDYESFEPKF